MGGLDVPTWRRPTRALMERRTTLRHLVERAQRGDVDAFAELVRVHAPQLHRLAAAIVGADDAADATQEALLSAWRQLPRLRDADRLEVWLRRILVNRCRNVLRARSRRLAPSVLDTEVGPDPADPGPPVDLQVEERHALDGVFEALTPEQRALVALHYAMDLSISESAKVLGISTGTAKSRLNGALSTLRAALSPEVDS